jgi:hypothetical protein
VFPGRAEGTLTERVAYCIQHDFIEKATLMCDLHTAGLDMRMIPIVGYTLDPPPGNPDALEQARAAAKAFGLKTIWSNAVDDGAPELTFQPGDEARLGWAPGLRASPSCTQKQPVLAVCGAATSICTHEAFAICCGICASAPDSRPARPRTRW